MAAWCLFVLAATGSLGVDTFDRPLDAGPVRLTIVSAPAPEAGAGLLPVIVLATGYVLIGRYRHWKQTNH